MISIENSGELLIVYLSGEIDHHNAVELREKTDAQINLNKPKHLILDFKNVTFMDSSGVGFVLGRYAVIHNIKGTLEVRGVNAHTKKLFELAGVGSIAIIKEA
ncbi:MAG: anti-sigma factor antagonist [Eubacterium sp.]|nr:anti-sigma factor antagonist [Eubacterium sp.]